MNITDENITSLGPDEIFVFGSNEQGIHGAGAAKTAATLFGARRGVGEGPTGSCYAIPTKRTIRQVRPLDEIATSVATFLDYARNHPDLHFTVTRIGCGFAGYEPSDIGPLFRGVPANVSLPPDFWEYV